MAKVKSPRTTRSKSAAKGTSRDSQSKSAAKGTSCESQSKSTSKEKASRSPVSKSEASVKARRNIVPKTQTNFKARHSVQPKAAKVSPEHTIYQFKITLRDTRPHIWRRIQIHKDTTFKNFHLAVVNSMGWANSHNHSFESPDVEFVPSFTLELDFGDNKKRIDEAKVKLSDYFKNPKDWILHMYDFGDGWEHAIQLEKILPPVPLKKYPICLDGRRACPPDDCGGCIQFREHCKIMSNPKHPEYKEIKEWLKYIGLKNWKADVFNPKSVKFWRY